MLFAKIFNLNQSSASHEIPTQLLAAWSHHERLNCTDGNACFVSTFLPAGAGLNPQTELLPVGSVKRPGNQCINGSFDFQKGVPNSWLVLKELEGGSEGSGGPSSPHFLSVSPPSFLCILGPSLEVRPSHWSHFGTRPGGRPVGTLLPSASHWARGASPAGRAHRLSRCGSSQAAWMMLMLSFLASLPPSWVAGKVSVF